MLTAIQINEETDVMVLLMMNYAMMKLLSAVSYISYI
jgi:hypothetical protein